MRPVENDFDRLRELRVKVVTAELLGETPAQKVRHSPDALAEVTIDLANRSRAHQLRRQALASGRKYVSR